MGKHSIDWHKECLRNMTSTAESYRRDAEAAKARFERVERDCLILQNQIAEAERVGMDGFDEERFGKKRSGR